MKIHDLSIHSPKEAVQVLANLRYEETHYRPMSEDDREIFGQEFDYESGLTDRNGQHNKRGRLVIAAYNEIGEIDSLVRPIV
jgi:hypothetical protein